jgi:hypothetical protein
MDIRHIGGLQVFCLDIYDTTVKLHQRKIYPQLESLYCAVTVRFSINVTTIY